MRVSSLGNIEQKPCLLLGRVTAKALYSFVAGYVIMCSVMWTTAV
jgi:hypothetical protein